MMQLSAILLSLGVCTLCSFTEAFVAPALGLGITAGKAGLMMSEEIDPETTAASYSAKIAHPDAVFGVDTGIADVLPHRYPFALVDKVIHFEPGKRAVGVKCITNNEPQFTGHFPDRPIMPGVLQVEAMAQLGGMIALQAPVSDGQGVFFFAGVDGVKWKKPVVPGDVLVMEMQLDTWKEKFGIAKMSGKAYVDGKVALEVKSFTFALAKDK
ncbi:unnamed protein product [Chrysoparadoxa australica]